MKGKTVMTEKTTEQETLQFRAEVQQLLNILANSLYTDREIFLRELISNASDALHRVQFEMLTNRDVVDPEADLEIHIDVDEEASTLTVSDTGIGMTEEERRQLFTKYFRSQREAVRSVPGTGLGLVITQSIIELHGGEVSVESELHQGSTFAFTIPVNPEQPEM